LKICYFLHWVYVVLGATLVEKEGKKKATH